MTRRSARWCAAIALSLVASTQPGLADPATDAAKSAAGAALAQFGSTEAIRQHATLPLTEEATALATVDGSASGPAAIGTPASSAFLTLSAAASATGDLAPVTIRQDLDFDGSPDFTYTAPFGVSGICANGVIACDPGTWDHCQAYGWSVDGSGRAGLQASAMNTLAGCSCVNQSCGMGSNNLQAMLKDLGGAVVGTLAAQRSGCAISRVELTDSTISYYGQDNSGSAAGSVAQSSYYGQAGAMSTDATDAIAAQSGDPTSYYSLVTGSFAAKGASSDLQHCTVSRSVSLNEVRLEDIITPLGGTGQVQYCGADCIRLVLGRQGDNYWAGYCAIFEENYQVYVNLPEMVRQATLVRAIWDDYIQVWIGGTKVYNGPNDNFPPETAGACELAISWNKQLNRDVTAHFQQAGKVETKIRVSVTGGGEGYAYVEVRTNNLCQAEETVTDNCAALAADSDCVLEEEEIDGVRIWQSFNPTGETVLPSTRTFTASSTCSQSLTRDWWQKNQTYRCVHNDTFDFSDAAKRVDSVVGTTEGNSAGATSVSYTDTRLAQGSTTWTTDDHTVTVNPSGPLPECEQACKTRKPVSDSQAALTGVSTDYQTSSLRYDTFYHVCPADNICPAGPDEEVVEDCRCPDEFADAAAAMMVLDEAGRDLTCSGGGSTATGDCQGGITIFTGQGKECLQNGMDTSFFNCCNDSIGDFLIFKEHCPDASLETVQAKQAGRTHFIGTYCKRNLPLVGCVQEADVYCVFNSKLGRIIQEQGRLQLKAFAPNGDWGSPGAPNCQGFTPEEFQMLDFSRIDLSDVFGDLAPLPAGQVQDAVEEKVEAFEGMVR